MSVVGDVIKNVGGGLAGIAHDPLKAVRDIGKFEGDHISNVFGRAKIGQLLMGAADPFSAHVQNKLFGTHYKPLVSQLGGARKEDYQHAASRGINTGSSQTMGRIADMLALHYGGQWAGLGAGNPFDSGAAAADGGTAAGEAGTVGGAGAAAEIFADGATPFLDALGSDVGGYTGMGALDTAAGSGFAAVPSVITSSPIMEAGAEDWLGDLSGGYGGADTPTGWLDPKTAANVSDIPKVSNVGGPLGAVQTGMKGMGVLGNVGALYTGMEQRRAGKALQREASQREGYGRQLAALEADPSSVSRTPGYQAGLEAIQRSMAAQGYMGSGNMMAEMAKYGQGVYDQRFRELSSLASGAGELAAAGAATKAGGTARTVLGAAGIGQNLYNLLNMFG